MIDKYTKQLDRTPWTEKRDQSKGPDYLQTDILTIYCGDAMLVPYGEGFDWLDLRSDYIFYRVPRNGRPHGGNRRRRFCDEQHMTTIPVTHIRWPQLPATDPIAVIIICPPLLDIRPDVGRRPTGSLEKALQRRELPLNTHMDRIVDLVVSPTLFHELFHVAVREDSKQFLSSWHSTNEHGSF
jgi:hypothetical protein